ncbi:hypothetical protein DFP72DRAFT_227480 [Ephemerocybe angulata]|uniref:Uncharacterized protein n=1 Tax=Ephemerocybe angulata TaxID=980116 RepID=A0A8H6H7E9_9AGAR|nr:hypothetical protein DFP72DRAFT_227480 [Tulosesus angulatus]
MHRIGLPRLVARMPQYRRRCFRGTISATMSRFKVGGTEDRTRVSGFAFARRLVFHEVPRWGAVREGAVRWRWSAMYEAFTPSRETAGRGMTTRWVDGRRAIGAGSWFDGGPRGVSGTGLLSPQGYGFLPSFLPVCAPILGFVRPFVRLSVLLRRGFRVRARIGVEFIFEVRYSLCQVRAVLAFVRSILYFCFLKCAEGVAMAVVLCTVPLNGCFCSFVRSGSVMIRSSWCREAHARFTFPS